MNDFYQMLNVNQFSSHEEIKKAYKDLAKKYHPDVNRGNSNATANFRKIKQAYDWLKKNHVQQIKPPPPPPNFSPFQDSYGMVGSWNIAIGTHALNNQSQSFNVWNGLGNINRSQAPHSFGGNATNINEFKKMDDNFAKESQDVPDIEAGVKPDFSCTIGDPIRELVSLFFLISCFLFLVYFLFLLFKHTIF